MASRSIITRQRRPTNVSLDSTLLGEARALGINVSRACEHGLAAAIVKTRAERWRTENADAIEASNAYVDANGLPLAAARLF